MASRLFLDGAATPPVSGGEFGNTPETEGNVPATTPELTSVCQNLRVVAGFSRDCYRYSSIDSFRSLLAAELRVFGFGFNQHRNVRVSVLPDGEEILVRLAGLDFVACKSVSAGQAEMR